MAKVKEEYEFEMDWLKEKRNEIKRRHGRFWEHAVPKPKLVFEYDDEVQEEVEKVEKVKQKIIAKGKKIKLKKKERKLKKKR